MNRTHLEIQEELTLWALGIVPDAPLPALAEHLAGCEECRRLVSELYETAGHLASGFKPLGPPRGLKERLMERVQTDPMSLLEQGDRLHVPANHARLPLSESDAAQPAAGPAAPKAERESGEAGGRRPSWAWVGRGAAAVLMFALLLGNISLNRHIEQQERQIDAWSKRYEADVRWLRSAEYLLVQEISPTFSALLAPPGEAEDGPFSGHEGDSPAPVGKATVYEAYDTRSYLLVWVSGLSPGQAYDVWVASAEAPHRIGPLTVDERGGGSIAHPAESGAVWEAVEVRGRDGSVLLWGQLHPDGSGARVQ